MSDKKLKDALKKHGLPVTGDKNTLIKRHKEFVLRHNSECDNLNPKSLQEIIADVMRAEQVPTKSIARTSIFCDSR